MITINEPLHGKIRQYYIVYMRTGKGLAMLHICEIAAHPIIPIIGFLLSTNDSNALNRSIFK